MKLKAPLALGLAALLGVARAWSAPAISSFTPTFGSSTDVNFIIIHGSGFFPGTLEVRFNGVVDPTATAAIAADGTRIQAKVPAGTPLGSGPIYVRVNDAATFSAADFTVIGPGPYVSNFTPKTGSGGTKVTVTGAHFFGTTNVRFDGKAGTGGFVSSDSTLEVFAPAGVTTGPISVERSGVGTNTTTELFYATPVVTGFSPTNGRAGTNIVITGTNFIGTTGVRFGTLDAAGFLVLSNNALQVTVPAKATNGPLRVITPAGSAFSGSNFVVQPTVTGFVPTIGAPGTNVTVYGANFNVGTPSVFFNGMPAATPTSVTFSNLVAVVPAAATTGFVTVSNVNGSHTSAATFYLPPAITGFTPSNSAPGTIVRVNGANFIGTTSVTFNGTPAADYFITNNTTIGAVVPAGVTTGPINVTAPAGTANSPTKFYGAPVINSYLPTHGLPGDSITLNGVNFTDATVVRFNGSNAVFNVLNNTTLTATVPANAQTGPITIITPGGSNTTTTSFVLDYTANVSVSIIDSPDPVVVGSNVIYTITVFNAGPFPAPGVTFSTTLIGPAQLLSAISTRGTLNTNTMPITGELGQLAIGDSVTITLTILAQSEGMITNTASVTSLYPDPTPANNSATNTTYVQPLPLLRIRQLDTSRVRLTWPAALTNYGLEFIPGFETNVLWSNPPTAPLIIGSEYQLTETNNQPMRYYRLRRLQ